MHEDEEMLMNFLVPTTDSAWSLVWVEATRVEGAIATDKMSGVSDAI